MRNRILNIKYKTLLIFYWIINRGVENNRQARHHLLVLKVTNIIHLLISITVSIVGTLYLFKGVVWLFWIDMLWLLTNVLCLYLNHIKKIEYSKNIFLLSIHLYVLAVSFIIGVREVGLYLLMASSSAIILIYNTKDALKIGLFFVVSIFNFLIIKYSPSPFNIPVSIDENSKKILEIITFSMCCLAIIIIIYSQKRMSANNEYFLLREIRHRRKAEKALTDAKRTADKANMAKSDFLSTISYNLRTPLNAILGLSNLLLLESPKKNQLQKLSILKNSTDNLIHLIDNLLDYNKIEIGNIDILANEFQVRGLVEDIYNSFTLKAQERKNEFTVQVDKDIPRLLMGDNVKLMQALVNLISNALKFTENGKVWLEVKLKNIQNNYVSIYFSVSDTGIGIAREKLKYIFDSTIADENPNFKKYGGIGTSLGLVLTKRIVEVLGGDIFVESHLGKGSKFFFSLNFKIPEKETPTDKSGEKESLKDLKGIKILLVDDNHMNLLVAETFLKRWNADVDTAEDGILAVDMAKSNIYDIILMDLQLPQISGFEATREIRSFNPNVAILALTADNYGFANENFKLLGINDVLIKPFYPDELFSKIERLILERTPQE